MGFLEGGVGFWRGSNEGVMGVMMGAIGGGGVWGDEVEGGGVYVVFGGGVGGVGGAVMGGLWGGMKEL